ncbi:hypothetical protein ABIA32_000029 [Streptacidiphilus sp. MAP12-20]|uniref:hypothetical protein n=1 Tax=Streptacidiphilus sp. MAP12-20 TaxID=3156299 RepID=UPI003518D1C7
MTRLSSSSVRRVALRLVAGATAGALAGLGLAAAVAPGAAAAPADSASSGTALAKAPTSSAVTVGGRGAFASMHFTVSQTRGLTDQAVSVSWTGGTPTTFAGSSFNTDYVQIMQCWGTDDGSVAGNPGPPPTQCEYGASPTTDRGIWPGNGYDDSRHVTYSAAPTHYGQDKQYGAGMPFGQGEVPFKAVDGESVTTGTQNNKFFNYSSTNEIDFGRTGADGTGQEFFETQTLKEAPQLGCGAPVSHADGTVTGRSCWLVIVPQGHLDLNGQPYQDTTQVNAGSAVSSTDWTNRIAVPLDFNPVGASCKIGAKEQPTAGSELASEAMTSWQAKLCASGTVYSYTRVGDVDARTQLAKGAANLVFTTDPLGGDQGLYSMPTDKVTYAPVAVSGLVIGFNIERQPGSTATPEERRLKGTRVGTVKLTARLIAKLLTESYRNSPWGAVRLSSGGNPVLTAAAGYAWALNNPAGLTSDPEFLALNPEFAHMAIAENPSTDTDLITALGHADTAQRLWAYIAGDADARAFLAGKADPSGMVVNPYYSTDATKNPTHTGFPLTSDDFPKSDPWSTVPPGSDPKADVQRMTDFHPYVDAMHDGAQHARRGDQLWKSQWDSLANPPVWRTPGPQMIGERFQLVVTDAASAARYGLQVAALKNSSGAFVAPTPDSLSAAASSTTPTSVAGVVTPAGSGAGAYPLTMFVYAAARPAALGTADRASYAALLRYAAAAGQVPGVEIGDLPPGYAPLSAALRAQTLAAAQAIVTYTGPSATSGGSNGGGTTGGSTGGSTGGAAGGGTGGSASGGAGGAGGINPAAAKTPAVTPNLIATATGLTPADPAVSLSWAVPIGAALGLLAALAAPFAGGWRIRLRRPAPTTGAGR